MKSYVIPFSGLKAGIYQYSFDIDGKFFDHFEYSEIKQAKVRVNVEMERKQRMLLFRFDISGSVRVPCDRCLEEFDLEIGGQDQLIVKFGEVFEEESEDIIIIREEDHEIDLSQYIYEYINLLIPFKKVHGEDDKGNSLCNPDILKYIASQEEEKGESRTDPRWEALRKLKNN